MKRFALSISLVLAFSALGPIGAVADEGPTISGKVTLDGAPLAGVEVFLATDAGPWYTCTDEEGAYEITDPLVGAVFFSATGPAVDVGLDCANPKFIDAEGTPLMVAFGGGAEAPATIDFEVERLPRDHPGSFNQLRVALTRCYDGNGAATADILADFEVPQKVGEEATEAYESYAETLRFIADGVCPQPPAAVVGS